jgi:WD40 repeat protein
VRIWDIASGECLDALLADHGLVDTSMWSPDGCRAVIKDEMWDANSGLTTKLPENASSLRWSPDGRLGLTLSGAEVKVWNMDSVQPVSALQGHSGHVTSVAWSPRGRFALSGSNDTTVRVWDVKQRKSLRVLKGNTGKILSVAWTSDGRRALSASDNGEIRVWDVAELVTE